MVTETDAWDAPPSGSLAERNSASRNTPAARPRTTTDSPPGGRRLPTVLSSRVGERDPLVAHPRSDDCGLDQRNGRPVAGVPQRPAPLLVELELQSADHRTARPPDRPGRTGGRPDGGTEERPRSCACQEHGRASVHCEKVDGRL